MARKNKLVESPPYEVEKSLKRLGANLRIARIRRSFTIEDVAERIGTGPRAVMDAERGRPTTGMVVYAALLWLYDRVHALDTLADPRADDVGFSLDLAHKRTRVRKKRAIDNDF
jgi:transcriptional regulator with XRE-family HTH domain